MQEVIEENEIKLQLVISSIGTIKTGTLKFAETIKEMAELNTVIEQQKGNVEQVNERKNDLVQNRGEKPLEELRTEKAAKEGEKGAAVKRKADIENALTVITETLCC